MVIIRHTFCPLCSSTDVEPRARPDYSDDWARLFRGFTVLFALLGFANILALGAVDATARALAIYAACACLGASGACTVGHALRGARAHARCRRCGCLWRK